MLNPRITELRFIGFYCILLTPVLGKRLTELGLPSWLNDSSEDFEPEPYGTVTEIIVGNITVEVFGNITQEDNNTWTGNINLVRVPLNVTEDLELARQPGIVQIYSGNDTLMVYGDDIHNHLEPDELALGHYITKIIKKQGYVLESNGTRLNFTFYKLFNDMDQLKQNQDSGEPLQENSSFLDYLLHMVGSELNDLFRSKDVINNETLS